MSDDAFDWAGSQLVTVAATQMSCSADLDANVHRAEALVREAAQRGANIILLQELFKSPYFCQDQLPENFVLAEDMDMSPLIARFSALAKELSVVLPISFFERSNHAYYNTVAMIDADGAVLGRYRKSHIPDGPGYQEKFYFSPGDTGFRVWKTRVSFNGIPVGIAGVEGVC